MNRFCRGASAFTLMLTVTGCAGAGLGSVGDILGGVLGSVGGAGAPQQGEMVVEVQGVNAQQRAIQVRAQNGQTGAVMYDQNTIVVYQQQQYPVTALERGDVVTMQVQQIDQNRLYTSRVDVQQSVQERTGQTGSAQLHQMSGRVGQIDHQRGFFELQTSQGTYTVLLPANPGSATTNYFHQLRAGWNVTVEGTMSGGNRLDLHRFI